MQQKRKDEKTGLLAALSAIAHPIPALCWWVLQGGQHAHGATCS